MVSLSHQSTGRGGCGSGCRDRTAPRGSSAWTRTPGAASSGEASGAGGCRGQQPSARHGTAVLTGGQRPPARRCSGTLQPLPEPIGASMSDRMHCDQDSSLLCWGLRPLPGSPSAEPPSGRAPAGYAFSDAPPMVRMLPWEEAASDDESPSAPCRSCLATSMTSRQPCGRLGSSRAAGHLRASCRGCGDSPVEEATCGRPRRGSHANVRRADSAPSC